MIYHSGHGTCVHRAALFQGIMVDAKGKTVGRIGAMAHDGNNTVIRQINGMWVELAVDPAAGFPPATFDYGYQSTDCTGQAYLAMASTG
jgi:hypothetical protein